MKNNELLKKYAGISTRIRRIFAYHYDQIQREVQTEISTLNPELQGQFMDLVIEYMEESINWPDPDDQETFEKHLKSFIQDKDQAEEMITQYTGYYNAIKRWESNHKETEILHQLEISNLLEQLKNN